MTLRFEHPAFLAVALPLLALALWGLWRLRGRRRPLALAFPALPEAEKADAKRRRLPWPFLLGAAGVGFLLVAAANPEWGALGEAPRGRGMDLVLALDLSSSMKAEDAGGRSRLEAAKAAALQVLEARPRDRIGLVTFAAAAFPAVPPTLDHAFLRRAIEAAAPRADREEETDLGAAVGAGLWSLSKSAAKAKTLLLLSDGADNSGRFTVAESAQAARALGVRIDALAFGEPGRHEVMVTVRDAALGDRKEARTAEMNGESLRSLADRTGGLYREARAASSFGDLRALWNRQEPSRLRGVPLLQRASLAPWAGWIALCLLVSAGVLARTRHRSLP